MTYQKISSKIFLNLLATVFIFLFIALMPSCKKADIGNEGSEVINGKGAEDFFNLPAGSSPVLYRIANELKRQNKTREFIRDFIAKEGLPVWHKASIEKNGHKIKGNSGSGFDGEGLEDTVVYIPLVVSEQKYVHGFLKATIKDTVEIKIFRQSDYIIFPFQTPQSTPSVTTAENFALRMMTMDRDVFGSVEFEIKDKRMFNNSTDYSDTANIQRFVKLDASSGGNHFSNGSTINGYTYELCYRVSTWTRVTCPGFSGSGGNNMEGGGCWAETYSDVCITYETGEEGGGSSWPFPPGGGGGNPSGGGEGPPCEYFGANIINSVVPIECEPGPGGNPWPPVLSIFSNLNNPVNAPDTVVVQSTLIEIGNIETNPPPPIRIIGKTQARGNTEDMEYGNNCDVSGILSNMPSFSDNQLFSEMNSLFTMCTIFDGSLRSVGNNMIQQFKDKIGGSYTNVVLGDKVFASSAFKNFIKKFGEILNQKLSNASWDITNVSEIDIPNSIRPRFTGTYNKFHGLQILINDTEQTIIELNNFSLNQVTHQWTAKITVTIKDHFGLDKNDALTYQDNHAGFAAWWILQHCRGYVPFETNVKVSLDLICNPLGN